MDLTVTPKRFARLFGAAVCCLVVAHLVVETLRFASGNERLLGLVPFFSIGSDRNLPTFYSALALLVCAALLGLIGVASRQRTAIRPLYWYGLAAVFVFLSIDEMLMLHEKMIEPLRSKLGTSGLFHYAWILPYGAGLLVLLAVYSRFLLRLPRRTAWLFIISGTVFVTGAIGFEMLGGLYFEAHGGKTIAYVALQTVEETLEMVGIVLFLYALADYLERNLGGIHVRLVGDSEARDRTAFPQEEQQLGAALSRNEPMD